MDVDIIDEGALFSEPEDFDGALHALALSEFKPPSEQHSDTDVEDFTAALHASTDSPSGDLSRYAVVLRTPGKTTPFSRYFFQPPWGAVMHSQSTLAHHLGITDSTVKPKLNACSFRSYELVRDSIVGTVRGLLHQCKSARALVTTGVGRPMQPAVYVRKRLYDSTPCSKMRCKSVSTVDDMDFVEMEDTKATKLLAIEASMRLGFRRLGDGINGSVQLHMKQPTILQMLEQGRGDDLHVAINRTESLPTDPSVLEEFKRVIDVVAADDDGANHRRERYLDSLHTDKPNRSRVQTRCTVHKKATGVKWTVVASDNIDTHLIRLGLSLQKTPRSKAMVRRELRMLIAEQLVVYDESVSPLTAEDIRTNNQIFSTFCRCDPENGEVMQLGSGPIRTRFFPFG